MGFKSEAFVHVKYYSAGATGSGASAADPAAAASGDIFAVPEGLVVEACDVIVTTAVTGSSPQINVGDDDDPNGYVADADVTEGTPGLYPGAGDLIATGAKMYYSAVGKEVKLAIGGTLSAGAFIVVVKGYRV